MSINFRVASVDGFGERDDIALARDKQSPSLWESEKRELAGLDKAIANATTYGTASDAQPITQIVQEMLERECYEKLMLKSEIVWNVGTLSEAVNEACIQLGLSDEDFSPSFHDLGNEVDIRLV